MNRTWSETAKGFREHLAEPCAKLGSWTSYVTRLNDMSHLLENLGQISKISYRTLPGGFAAALSGQAATESICERTPATSAFCSIQDFMINLFQ